ncbi:YbaB/EbfC family nucleoid-associated protein [Lentzea sp. NPDC005914]|uniref:YbaB/EbfC family nucleoid-associated protein n=1 Tax=Lentzea sp. NPDC005914 TaxID=3154572 RepID=UPI0033E82FB9
MSSPLNAAEINARAAQVTERAAHLHTQAGRRRKTLDAARTQAVSVTASASDPDGSVKATVDAGGMLTGLVLTPAVQQLNVRQLAALVVRVTQEAAAQARGAVRQVYSPLQNEGVVRDMPVLLPEVAPPAAAPAPAPVRRPVQREEDFSGPVMKDEGW